MATWFATSLYYSLLHLHHKSFYFLFLAVVKDIQGDSSSYHKALKEIQSEEFPIDNFNIIFAGFKLLITSSIGMPEASFKSEVSTVLLTNINIYFRLYFVFFEVVLCFLFYGLS